MGCRGSDSEGIVITTSRTHKPQVVKSAIEISTSMC